MVRQGCLAFVAAMVSMLNGCGGGGGGGSAQQDAERPCIGSQPTTAIAPLSCDAATQAEFLGEHFQWVAISAADGEKDYGFVRFASTTGNTSVAYYDYSPATGTYNASTPLLGDTNRRIQNAAGSWLRFQFEWMDKATLGTAVAGADGDEYPLAITSPDDAAFTLALRFKQIVAADLTGLQFRDARFNDVYVGGHTGTYPPGAKAFSAKYAFAQPATILVRKQTVASNYTTLQQFTNDYASTIFCLGNGYGVIFDQGTTKATLFTTTFPASSSCAITASYSRYTVDLSTQTVNGVENIVLSGTALPTVGTFFDVVHAKQYEMLIAPGNGEVVTAYHIAAGASFTYMPGAGVYMNKAALNAMFAKVGKPTYP